MGIEEIIWLIVFAFGFVTFWLVTPFGSPGPSQPDNSAWDGEN